MESHIYKSIVAFKNKSGSIFGLHTQNLEVAELTPEVWKAIEKAGSNPSDLEALRDLDNWESSKNTETRSDPRFTYINSVNINVTQVCNLHCLYCEAGGDGSYGQPEKRILLDKAIPSLNSMLRRIPNSGEFTITFVGGEPLLYPEGMQLLAEHCIEQLKPRGIDLSFRVVTNGTLFNEKAMSVLKKFQMSIVVSLDGPAELQNKLRPTVGGGHSSDMLERGLALLKKNQNDLGPITLRAVFGEHNTDIETVYSYLSNWDVGSWEFNFDVSCSTPSTSNSFLMSYLALAEKVFIQNGEKGLRRLKFFDRVFDRLDRRMRVENFCDYGKSFAVIDAKGDIFRCPWETNFSQKSVGSGENFSTKKLEILNMSLIEHNNCQTCWARHLCGGGCMYAHTKATQSPHAPDPAYCTRTRSLLSAAIMYYLKSREVEL